MSTSLNIEDIASTLAEQARQSQSLEPLLPLLLWLDGRPLTLDNYAPFRPIFDVALPSQTLLKTGRQVGKTTSLFAMSTIRAAAIPHHRLMYVITLKDLATSVSTTYLKQFTALSPIKNILLTPSCKKSTLFKEFRNGSRIVLRYAKSDPSRIRSFPNDVLLIDEFQDFDPNDLPVIRETLTASQWRITLYAGTPLTHDNILNVYWMDSTRSEWLIKCDHCNHWNIPSAEHDLINMIGPYHDDISPECPGTVCAKCRKPINPRFGQWVPANREKLGYFHGYHIPQVILPMHFEDRDRWRELVEKMESPTYPRYRFYNEVLGECWDEGVSAITRNVLEEVAVLPPASINSARERRSRYIFTVLSVDWGGGGQAGTSRTTVCFAGLTPDNFIEIPWGTRLIGDAEPFAEAEKIIQYYNILQPDAIVHDFTGGIGSLRETILKNRGVPVDILVPFYIVGSTTNYMVIPVVAPERSRSFFKVDRTRALQLVLGAIRGKVFRFFDAQDDASNQNLLNDFLDLQEETKITVSGRETYRILRKPGGCDDFAIAVMLAASYIWHVHDAWPQF